MTLHSNAPVMFTQQSIHVLLVENDPTDAACFEASLRGGNIRPFSVTRATTLDAAHRAAEKSSFDIVVLDLDLPDSHGLDTLDAFRPDVDESVPILILTGSTDDHIVNNFVIQSGNECLIKGHLDPILLPRLLRQAVDRQRTHVSMRRLISTNPDGIVVIDQDGVVVCANIAAAELFHREPDDLIGQSFGFPVLTGSSTDINTLSNRIAEMRAVEIDWNGRGAFLVTLRDVTERHALMTALRIAKDEAELANRVRDEILNNMNHEVRTPLNSIIGFSDLMLTDEKKFSDYVTTISYLESINQSGWHLLELLTDVLDMANIRTNNFELMETEVDVERTFQAVGQLMRSQIVRAGLKFESEAPQKSPHLLVDEKRLKQMLGHLLSNAIKFNRPGGSVGLKLKTTDTGDIQIAISDSGIGMDNRGFSKAESIFGRLGSSYTTNTGGAGLGLSLTKGMIERHGGLLIIESEPGIGTTATLHFPASRAITKYKCCHLPRLSNP